MDRLGVGLFLLFVPSADLADRGPDPLTQVRGRTYPPSSTHDGRGLQGADQLWIRGCQDQRDFNSGKVEPSGGVKRLLNGSGHRTVLLLTLQPPTERGPRQAQHVGDLADGVPLAQEDVGGPKVEVPAGTPAVDALGLGLRGGGPLPRGDA